MRPDDCIKWKEIQSAACEAMIQPGLLREAGDFINSVALADRANKLNEAADLFQKNIRIIKHVDDSEM